MSEGRILVTGGSGFIGTNLINHCVAVGNEVLNLDIAKPRSPAQTTYWKNVDLCDLDGLRAEIREFRPEVIFHMGARTDLSGKSVQEYAANTVGVQNLIESVDGLTSLRRIVFASSRLVCRNGYIPTAEFDYCPSTVYGESKVIGEQIVRSNASRLPCTWVIVRPTSIWGPWFGIPYKTFFLTIGAGRYVHPGKLKILKSFGFVWNTVFELQRLVDADPLTVSGRTFYLADYPPIDVLDMANAIQRAMGAAPIKSINPVALRLLAFGGDVLKLAGWPNPPLTSFRLDNLLTRMVYDMEPLKGVVGELPYTMSQGVYITCKWLMEHK